jgi:class 3 adenylate cyclase/tetratricopeptide (TPR) repeat protein
MTCAACGTDNRPDRKFCANCGAPLAVRCANCGASNLPGERFCGECGRPLVGDATPAATVPATPPVITSTSDDAGAAVASSSAPAPTTAERRLVSVLFADLVEFTRLSERLDVEAVRELQTAYFGAAREVIGRHGGLVEKFIGDAVMAVWGAPLAHEDDAERSVRAALGLVDAIARLRDELNIPELNLRSGVLTGEAAVVVGAVGEGLVSGDLVNTAARIQSVARPGTVLVGEATMRATEAAIAYEKDVAADLKGKSAPVQTWRATHVVAGRRGAGRSGQLEAPFVGRAADLRALKDALEGVGRERRPQFVGVIGQAGIGKSRLAWELEKHVDGLVETVYWHRGRSPAYGEGLAYWAIGEMIRERARIAETDDQAETAAKLATMLGEYVEDPELRRWIEPHLRVLLGLDPSASADRTEQFAAWRQLFESIAQRGTTVLVFEDLQWADSGVVDFIDSLMEWSRHLPILVVALTRPELLETRPSLGAASRNALRLHLEALSDDQTRELLVGVAPGLSTRVVDALVERAAGIPLYAIELIRMLRAEGVDDRDVDVARLAIPPSLKAVVAARIDALPSDERSLLQDAAVLGASFTAGSLAAVAGRSDDEVASALRSLVRREILELQADPRSPERGQYSFVQAVIHEVAYSTLSRRDRRGRHLAAARYFETLDDPELAQILATHYMEAYRAAPDDQQGAAIRVQARLALRAAAERSAQLHNDMQALRLLDEALELMDDPTERAAATERQAMLADAAAEGDTAIAKAELARTTYEQVGDLRAAARMTGLLGQIELKVGRHQEAMALLERALPSIDPDLDPEGYARIAAQMARGYMLVGRSREAVEWADRALAAAGPNRAVEIVAESLNTKGTALQELQRYDESLALIRAAMEMSAANRLSNSELRARYNLAGRLVEDEPEEAIELLRGGIELASRTGRLDWRSVFREFVAAGLHAYGYWDELEGILDQTLSDDRTPRQGRANALHIQASLAAARGDQDTHRSLLARAIELAGDADDPQRQGEWAAQDASVALAEGRFSDVYAVAARNFPDNWRPIVAGLAASAAVRDHDPERAQAYLSSTRQQQGRFTSAIREAVASAIRIEQGDDAGGLASATEALRQIRSREVPRFLGDALLDLVFALGPAHPATPALAEEARGLFETMDAQRDLEQLDVAMATQSRRTAPTVPSAPSLVTDRS